MKAKDTHTTGEIKGLRIRGILKTGMLHKEGTPANLGELRVIKQHHVMLIIIIVASYNIIAHYPQLSDAQGTLIYSLFLLGMRDYVKLEA